MLTDLPNVLTLSRIVAIPIIAAMTAFPYARLGGGGGALDLVACLVFAAAGITDYLDGRLARDRSQDERRRAHARPDRRQTLGRRCPYAPGRPGDV